MNPLNQYINKTLGVDIYPVPVNNNLLRSLPMFINQIYRFYNTVLLNKEIILAELKNNEDISILQTDKHLQLLKKNFHKSIVLVIKELTAYNRKRLIEKGINFIVPGKQLYLPEFLIDLRESFTKTRTKSKNEKLLPSAQFILIYHILHRNESAKLENLSFKEMANKLGYTAMAITKAVENLKYLGVVNVVGEKQKFIRFRQNIVELWQDMELRKLWITPVLKKVFLDEIPDGLFLLKSNISALSVYSDINPDRQKSYAINKTLFYELQKNNPFINANEYDGKYCLEVWKYNPLKLVSEMQNYSNVIDPLSLYLSLQENKDERIEMALEQIKLKFIW